MLTFCSTYSRIADLAL